MKFIREKINHNELTKMAQNNRSRDVLDPLIKKKIIEVVNKLIE